MVWTPDKQELYLIYLCPQHQDQWKKEPEKHQIVPERSVYHMEWIIKASNEYEQQNLDQKKKLGEK